MGKHLKRLRSEKAKVQLKKKKLPKGQNVTDASFKVKKITIAEQLPTHGVGVPVTSANKTIKDLLNQLHHHNATSQVNSLKGIKELFDSNPTLSKGLILRKVVTGVLELCVGDLEKKVRRAAVKLLSHILTPLPLEARSSFTGLLNKQLQRGLSHINCGIQGDSLKLLDLVIIFTPDKQFSDLQVLLSLLIRMLTVTGASATPRQSVLKRIHSLCKIGLRGKENNPGSFVQVCSSERFGPLTSVYKNYPCLNLDKRIQGNTDDEQCLFTKLMNTLIGVWTETSPDNFIAETSVELLKSLVDIITVLCSFLDQRTSDPDSPNLKNWFRSSFKKPVSKCLLNHFPYQPVGTNPVGGRQADFTDKSETSTALIALNLTLAQLYYWFKIQQPFLEQKTEKFVFDCLQHRVGSEMIPLLDTMLGIKSKQGSVITAIAKNCLETSDPKLTSLLCRIVVEPSLSLHLQNPVVQSWVEAIANNLTNASEERLTVLSILAGRNASPILQNAVFREVPIILNRTDNSPLDTRFKQILHILYWTIPHDHLKKALEHSTSEKVKHYMGIILS